MAVVGLRVWGLEPCDAYDINTETAAVRRAAFDRGWRRYHLFGFSAGATVALAAALADRSAIRSIALFEPATIGDDDWSRVAEVMSGCSHLDPPHRSAADQLAQRLLKLWDFAAA